MKHYIYLLIAIISLVATSCDPNYDNKGYPKKVQFSENGGEKVIRGKECALFITLDNGKERYNYRIIDEDFTEANLDWLTVRAKWPEESLTLIAAPKSEIGGSKEINIELLFGPEFGEIKVIRE